MSGSTIDTIKVLDNYGECRKLSLFLCIVCRQYPGQAGLRRFLILLCATKWIAEIDSSGVKVKLRTCLIEDMSCRKQLRIGQKVSGSRLQRFSRLS